MFALVLALASQWQAPLNPVRTDGADSGLVVTTPYLGIGAGDCNIYPYTYYDGTCAHPAWDLGSVYGGAFLSGEPVHAAAAGTIAALDPDSYCGTDVFVDHGNGVLTRYCHLSSIAGDLYVGMPVEARHVVGFVGMTGASAPHLHFEARSGGIYGAYMNLGDPLAFPIDANPGDPPADPCGGLDYLGACTGDTLAWCENNALQSVACAERGQTCAYENDTVGFNCLDVPPADDPPADPPVDNPPTDDPPADPPADDPPADDPPADTPDDPPTDDTPADTPSDDTPVDDPPADDPPGEDTPANDPSDDTPVDDPSDDVLAGHTAERGPLAPSVEATSCDANAGATAIELSAALSVALALWPRRRR